MLGGCELEGAVNLVDSSDLYSAALQAMWPWVSLFKSQFLIHKMEIVPVPNICEK